MSRITIRCMRSSGRDETEIEEDSFFEEIPSADSRYDLFRRLCGGGLPPPRPGNIRSVWYSLLA